MTFRRLEFSHTALRMGCSCRPWLCATSWPLLVGLQLPEGLSAGVAAVGRGSPAHTIRREPFARAARAAAAAAGGGVEAVPGQARLAVRPAAVQGRANPEVIRAIWCSVGALRLNPR